MYIYIYIYICIYINIWSNTPFIDHLSMREFVGGPPSYRSIQKKCPFSKNSVLNPETAHKLSPKLCFLSRTLLCMSLLLRIRESGSCPLLLDMGLYCVSVCVFLFFFPRPMGS